MPVSKHSSSSAAAKKAPAPTVKASAPKVKATATAKNSASPSNTTVGVRRNLWDIQRDYDSKANLTELPNLMRAWQGIKALPFDDPRSFFTLGGFHGEPFGGNGWSDATWWGGYCQHGTVLFPTWHRAYLHKLERALQSIPGCETVMLPFWDECSTDSQTTGIPPCLTDETFVLDNAVIPNPLKSFTLPVNIVDNLPSDGSLYTKPAGYKTVRYPLSGLVGTEDARKATLKHNAQYADPVKNTTILNSNVKQWLTTNFNIGTSAVGGIVSKFQSCLTVPSYAVFSNTTSAAAYNNKQTDPSAQVTPLESPHNYMHLAVGGFDVPGQGELSVIPGANGDMGENDTAGLDPIFFFHHCFVDYAFWIWQQRNGATEAITIDPTDPGTVYDVQANQPPHGADPSKPLTVDTPLMPFIREQLQQGSGAYMTTRDVVNPPSQLGYTYGPGSLDAFATAPSSANVLKSSAVGARRVHVADINRARIRGSFMVAAYAFTDADVKANNTKGRLLGIEPVLSRWHLNGCANCLNHLRVEAHFAADPNVTEVLVEVRTRDGVVGSVRIDRNGNTRPAGPAPAAARALLATVTGAAPAALPFTVTLQ